jgi:phosphoglycolate phosphatase-like HAD superfamily hydrolase
LRNCYSCNEDCAAGRRRATYHVGDTPFDVKAAKQAGAVPVGVSTGIFTREQLHDAESSTVHVESFTDVASALKTFHLH